MATWRARRRNMARKLHILRDINSKLAEEAYAGVL
jgi:hypothetical protein